MPAVTLKAHYDGVRIVLDEPFDLPSNASLLVTVLPRDAETERAQWERMGIASLVRAYSDEEPEYSEADIRP